MKKLKVALAKLQEAARQANVCASATKGFPCVLCIAEVTMWHAEFQRLLLNGVECSQKK